MSAHQAVFPVAVMARVLGVSEAGFHAWRHRPASAHAVADAALLKRIRTIHAGSRETYGAPRVHAELRAGGEKHGRKRIARLMRAAGLIGASRRRGSIVTTRRDKEVRPAPDLVDRDFTALRPNQLWVADITFVPTASGFLYLAVVLDAWSRKIIGWSMGAPNWCWTRWRWRSASGGRTASSITATRAANTHRWRSANVARRLASGRQWDRSVMPTTTPCARASSPPSNANCWSDAGSRPRSRPRWPASASSKVGTTRCGCTQPSAIARQWPMKRRWRRSRQNRNHPSPTSLHESGATSTAQRGV